MCTLITFIVVLSCNSGDNDIESQGTTGEWKLIEMLADPGDGSGQYVPVESSKSISILEDGTYSSNGDICSFSVLVADPSSGNYEETENGYVIDCQTPFLSHLRLSLDNDGYLIVAFACIEPCLQKFERKQ